MAMDQHIAEAFAFPSGKTRALAQFNKLSRVLVGILIWVDPTTLNNEYFEYREIEINFDDETVVGNADDFQVVNVADLPQTVYEASLDLAAQERITKEYPLVRQINVFARAIQRLSEVAQIEQAELEEMLDYIDEIKRENRVRKEFFAASPDYVYVSYEDDAQDKADKLEGGLHEAYGGRVITGGRVF